MTSSNRGPARTGFSLTGIASKTDSESPVITLSVSESDLTGVNDDLGPVSGDGKTMRSSSAQISVPTTTPSSSSLSQRQILTGIFSGLFFLVSAYIFYASLQLRENQKSENLYGSKSKPLGGSDEKFSKK